MPGHNGDLMARILVTEEIAEGGLDRLRAAGHEVDVQLDLDHLLTHVKGAHALIVRSATQVTAEVLDAATELMVVGRAGIGLDNVDVEAATRKGVMVVNAPQSNILSAAEHTLALLMALARNIPQADTSLRGGGWERERFQGVELHGKTLGIVGLGRVGTMVAQRALSFGMRLIAYDPYVPKDRARELGIELMPDLGALLVQADFITIHLPKTSETEALIGERELSLMKEDALIVNTARGGIIHEAALAKALEAGRLGGAAVDVFETEPPPPDHPLIGLPNAIVTPHLGAATREAQDKAGIAIAEMVRLALKGEFVPYAVNVAAAEVPEQARPFLPLAERLGRILTGLADAPMRAIAVEYLGKVAELDTRVLTLAALKGALADVVHEPVSYVNAPTIAKERGLEVSERRSVESQDYVNLVLIRAETEAGEVAVGGTLVGKRDAERLVLVYDFDLDMAPAEHMAFFLYEDRAGVIGTVGTVLGEAGVNIASMEVGRKEAGGLALMGLTVDSPIPDDVIEQLVQSVGMKSARSIALLG